MGADWSSIEAVCAERAVMLDKNHAQLLARARYRRERERLEDLNPVPHTPTCNLFPGYSSDPKTWAKGCDCGAMAIAAAARRVTR